MNETQYKEIKNKIITIQAEIDRIYCRIAEENSALYQLIDELGYLYNQIVGYNNGTDCKS